MEKLYKKIGWKNKPNLATPLGATNLKKIDEALDGLDNRTIELDNKDAEQGRHIEGLYAETRKNTQAIEEGFDALKIVPTASGSPVYIFDASNMGIEDITFYGESKQLQTTGAQLVDIADFTLVKPDTRTKSISFETIEAGTYNLNVKLQGTATYVGVRFVGVDGTNYTAIQLKDGNNVLTCDGQTDKFWFFIAQEQADGVTANISDVMLSVEPLPYEKYTGRKPSPNPDYPQPIESKIVNEVVVTRKNELDCSGLSVQTTAGITFTPKYDDNDALLQYVNVNGIWDSSNTATNTRYKLGTWYPKTKGDYILSGMSNIGEGSFLCLDKNGAGGGYEAVASTSNKFTVAEDAEYYDVWLRIASGTTVSNLKIYPMIRLANITDATYEPYESQTVNLSAPIELNGFGGVRDTDKLKNIYVKVFTGNESFRTYTPGVGGIQFGCEDENIMQIESENVLCTHLPPKFTWNVREDGIALTSSSSVVVRFRMESLGISTVEDLKAKLKEWYDAGNPMVLYAPIKTPIETELPIVDQTAIKNLHTYKPNTVVMNDADAEMDVHYVADAKTYIDKKFEALASAIEK